MKKNRQFIYIVLIINLLYLSFLGYKDRRKIEKFLKYYLYYVEDYIIDDDKVNLDKEKCIQYIENSNLKDEYKNMLKNEEFFSFVLENINNGKFNLKYKLENIEVVAYTDIEKENSKEDNIVGYYLPSEISKLHIYEDFENKELAILAHEFCHMVQSCDYPYIREATAEMLASDFFTGEITAYNDLVNRVDILIDLVGVEGINDIVLNNSKDKLLEEINTLLDYDEANILIELFKYKHNSDEYELMEVNYQIDCLLIKMIANKYGIDEDKASVYLYDFLKEDNHTKKFTRAK